ncbi:MAG: NAD-dependent epimerase/dehydratase family protein, partial [Rhodospirillales bacterium]|nr:NAD-dependent epimerase/dehydratase family protein [Rhodospirillales bacterium]
MFYKNQPCLVTGGSGFVGTHIVKALLDQGADVRIPVHERKPLIDDPRIETIDADLTRPEDCLSAVRGMRFVFHAAGAVAGAGLEAAGAMSGIATNLTLTSRILEAAWAEKVERLLLFGSSTAYPAAEHPVRENELWDAPPHPSYLGYGWMRRYIERMGEFVARDSGVGISIVRPTAVYGPHDNFDPKTSHVIAALIRRAVEGEDPFIVWGTGDEVRDILHISDL